VQLLKGMHVHALEGSWIDRPFWRSRFVIDDARDLQHPPECVPGDCRIEAAKGLGIVPAPSPEAPAAGPGRR
jgi:Domain of unknown function (DUF3391)